ncbi:MAG: HAD-IIB family hydrolase [Fibrobacterota bacterium]
MRVLATDLDRTLLPNGPAPADPGIMELLHTVLQRERITPVFVTARRGESVINRVIDRYGTPRPAAIIGAVGAEIFTASSRGEYKRNKDWDTHLAEQSANWNPEAVENLLTNVDNITLQPAKEQHTWKRSYYIDSLDHYEDTWKTVEDHLLQNGPADLRITHSRDLNARIGYIDITPAGISKKAALRYYAGQTGLHDNDILFAGDSGNDLPLLTSSMDALIVANAEGEIKEKTRQNKTGGVLHVARGRWGLNGNYAAGILEGLHRKGWITESTEKFIENAL